MTQESEMIRHILTQRIPFYTFMYIYIYILETYIELRGVECGGRKYVSMFKLGLEIVG